LVPPTHTGTATAGSIHRLILAGQSAKLPLTQSSRNGCSDVPDGHACFGSVNDDCCAVSDLQHLRRQVGKSAPICAVISFTLVKFSSLAEIHSLICRGDGVAFRCL
jgi:hypothetical protein